MSKMLPNKISTNQRKEMLDLLYTKISHLKTKQAVENFMTDLLTESEKVMILRRLQIAKMLLEEKTYFEIRKELGVGIDTIKNVRKNLDFGHGGYINFIEKM